VHGRSSGLNRESLNVSDSPEGTVKIGPQAPEFQVTVGCDASFGGTHGTVQPTSPLQMGEWVW